jgi:hypothetical protein
MDEALALVRHSFGRFCLGSTGQFAKKSASVLVYPIGCTGLWISTEPLGFRRASKSGGTRLTVFSDVGVKRIVFPLFWGGGGYRACFLFFLTVSEALRLVSLNQSTGTFLQDNFPNHSEAIHHIENKLSKSSDDVTD